MKLFFRKSGSGAPMIILHGLFGISDNWASLAKRFSEKFTVYAVDLRNHGQSPHSEDWDYSFMAADVLELMNDEKPDDVILIGHSMGGKVAMRLALDHPLRVNKLIVADISPRETAETQREVVEALEAVHPETLASRKEAEAKLAQRISEQGTLQFLLKNLFWKEFPDGEKKLAWRFNLPVISRKLIEVSAATDSPAPCLIDTLFIRGEKSSYITGADEAEIASVFPNVNIVTIPGAGHWVHADKPDAFYAAVMEFLS